MLYTYVYLHAALTRRTNGEAQEPSENNALSEILKNWLEKRFHLLDSLLCEA